MRGCVFFRFAMDVMLARVIYIHCHALAEHEPPSERAASSMKELRW